MSDKKNDIPKVPPFVIQGSGKTTQEPASQPAHIVQAPSVPVKKNGNKNGKPSERGMLSLAVLLISLLSLGIAMLSGAKFAYDILSYKDPGAEEQTHKQESATTTPTTEAEAQPEATPVPDDKSKEGDSEQTGVPNKYDGVIPKIIVIGLAYLVGWLFTAFGIRILGNLVLPIFINVYAWITLAGLLALQFAIISRLFAQAYEPDNFIRYISLYVAGLIALVGLHLVLPDHKLVFFAVPILMTSLAHLFLTVVHFIFLDDEIIYEKLWGDLVFFAITTSVSILMLARFGILNGFRQFIDRTFRPNEKFYMPIDE